MTTTSPTNCRNWQTAVNCCRANLALGEDQELHDRLATLLDMAETTCTFCYRHWRQGCPYDNCRDRLTVPSNPAKLMAA